MECLPSSVLGQEVKGGIRPKKLEKCLDRHASPHSGPALSFLWRKKTKAKQSKANQKRFVLQKPQLYSCLYRKRVKRHHLLSASLCCYYITLGHATLSNGVKKSFTFCCLTRDGPYRVQPDFLLAVGNVSLMEFIQFHVDYCPY